jgi:hypothetical protein
MKPVHEFDPEEAKREFERLMPYKFVPEYEVVDNSWMRRVVQADEDPGDCTR